jgi:cytosine/adenosine deaminase-related metal-dependent hydrolase
MLELGAVPAGIEVDHHPDALICRRSIDTHIHYVQTGIIGAFGSQLIGGEVLMDRNAPDGLLDTPLSAYDDSKALIGKWHDKGRNLYAITPRFAPTSTPERLELAGALWRESPGTFHHTHVSGNLNEIKWVREPFPERPAVLLPGTLAAFLLKESAPGSRADRAVR